MRRKKILVRAGYRHNNSTIDTIIIIKIVILLHSRSSARFIVARMLDLLAGRIIMLSGGCILLYLSILIISIVLESTAILHFSQHPTHYCMLLCLLSSVEFIALTV